DAALAGWWACSHRAPATSNCECATYRRYCREQGDLLRALEDLAAAARAMHELDDAKDQVMTACKVAWATLVMWVRDRYVPDDYARATWGRLAPFFRLPGRVVVGPDVVTVELRPFNDRRVRPGLGAVCRLVGEAGPRLPDGRVVRFTVGARSRTGRGVCKRRAA
ncbi:MAG: hypothetical protein M3Q65_19115, partial [Chloroflexota bacterium]|nr:hypothetical protein [Chloroflexota bacterium]